MKIQNRGENMSDTKYIVRKISRCYNGGPGYAGPSCKNAGITPGAIFSTRKEAELAAKKLTEYNPVGFTVEEYKEHDNGNE